MDDRFWGCRKVWDFFGSRPSTQLRANLAFGQGAEFAEGAEKEKGGRMFRAKMRRREEITSKIIREYYENL